MGTKLRVTKRHFQRIRDMAVGEQQILAGAEDGLPAAAGPASRLNGLYGRTERVVLTWEGDAREMFVDALDRWDRSVQDLEGAQGWLHDVVVNGHVNYDAAHRAVLRGWGGA